MSAVITCCCPTHGRAHIIGEAVESYLRQEPCGVETELLILNDCPEQPLVCNAPGVRVVNVPLMESVCHKFDAVVEMAEGDWIAWWEDDDISLPWRLRMSVERSKLAANYKQRNAWYWNSGRIEKLGENLFFGNSFFRKGPMSHPEEPGATDTQIKRRSTICTFNATPAGRIHSLPWKPHGQKTFFSCIAGLGLKSCMIAGSAAGR